MYTLSEVWEIMKSMSNSEPNVLKRQLKEHYHSENMGLDGGYSEILGRAEQVQTAKE